MGGGGRPHSGSTGRRDEACVQCKGPIWESTSPLAAPGTPHEMAKGRQRGQIISPWRCYAGASEFALPTMQIHTCLVSYRSRLSVIKNRSDREASTRASFGRVREYEVMGPQFRLPCLAGNLACRTRLQLAGGPNGEFQFACL